MKIAHIADVHLDSPFALFSPEIARARRQAIETTLRGALEAAAEWDAEAIFVAGDLYEHDRVAPDTGRFLLGLFGEASPTPIFVSPGNHDWIGPSSLYARLRSCRTGLPSSILGSCGRPRQSGVGDGALTSCDDLIDQIGGRGG